MKKNESFFLRKKKKKVRESILHFCLIFLIDSQGASGGV